MMGEGLSTKVVDEYITVECRFLCPKSMNAKGLCTNAVDEYLTVECRFSAPNP